MITSNKQHAIIIFLSSSSYADTHVCIPSTVMPISISAIMLVVGIATFIAGVVMLVRARGYYTTLPSPMPLGLTAIKWWMKERRWHLLVQGSRRR